MEQNYGKETRKMEAISEEQDVEINFPEGTFHIPAGITNQTKTKEKVEMEKKPMLIFHITTTDPAGAGYNMIRALNQYTPHMVRMVNLVPNVYHHPSDIGDIHDYGDEIEQLLFDADVIHLHKIKEDFEIEIASSRHRKWKVSDFLNIRGKKKKIVYHVHGHPYERANAKENAEEYKKRDALVLCSTPDLQGLYAPHCNAMYFPNCVPIWHPSYLPRATNKPLKDKEGKERYIVSHTVSNRDLKNCKMIEEAVVWVNKTKPVNLLEIANVPHKLALTQRRLGHITFDHMQGYYGLASLEALSMGKPTIAGLNDHCIRSIIDFFKLPGDILPWQRPRDQRALNECLMDLVANIDVSMYQGKLGREFMEKYWSDENIAKRLSGIYESL